jgi:pimeloyl-ACP methyl ester carboxylesterase
MMMAAVDVPATTPADAEIILCRAKSHPMRYYLALPRGWRPEDGKRWPVLVCLSGAAADFRQTALRFRAASCERPCFVVVPCSFSSSNQIRGAVLERYRELYSDDEIAQAGGPGLIPAKSRRLDWDEAGLLAILDDLRSAYGVGDRVWLTGFSAGGHLSYRMVARHPERLAGVVTVCANFDFAFDRYPGTVPAEVRSLPVHIVTGERDPLNRYLFGSAYLPAPLVLLLVVAGLSVGGGFFLVRVGKLRRAVWVWVAGLLLSLGMVANHWAGIGSQADAAVGVLMRLGFTNVQRCEIPGLAHESAPSKVLHLLDNLAVQ